MANRPSFAVARFLADGCRILSANGQDDLNQGQVSSRIHRSTRFLIKRGACSFAEAGPEDMVEVSQEVSSALPPDAPPETALHQAIYTRRPDVGAIVHTHGVSTIVFGAFRIPLRPLSHDGAMFTRALGLFEATTQTILDSGSAFAVAEALGDGLGVLLRNHGSVVVGPSIRHAVVGALVLERACDIQLRAMAAGPGWVYSSDEDVDAKRSFVWSTGAIKTYWDSLIRQCPGLPGGVYAAGAVR